MSIPEFAFLTEGPQEYLESIYLGTTFLGQHRVKWLRTNGGLLAYVASTAFFCPECGNIWARISRSPAPNGWTVHISACDKHGGGTLIESSFQEERFDLNSSPLEWFRYETYLRLINDQISNPRH